MQLEEGRKSQPAAKKKRRGDDNITLTREINYFIILLIEKKHFTCIRGKTKMMRKYDVEWKDTYNYTY